jgi:hypothetical protein
MFWYKHVVAYSSLLASQDRKISPELLGQLRRLLQFKRTTSDSHDLVFAEHDQDGALTQWEQFPDIRYLLQSTIVFRKQQLEENNAEKTPDGQSVILKAR